MYQFERNSRIYMKGEGAESGAGGNGQRKSALSPSSRPASRSPMQELSGGNKSPSYHKSSQAIHNGAADGQHGQTKSLRDSQQRAISTELGDLTAPGETKTKTQMAREFQESQELYKSADSKAGLQTVKTRRVLKKTTTITRGENEKLEDNSNFREILLRWAQKTTDGYPGCKVTDLTTSWRDGLAFNAILHRNRPDLLDYRACRKKTSRENLHQAFDIGDRELGVAKLLEPEDVDVAQPDEKSMITYLAQLYELFPDPPERNPLLDEEMVRRIDEYKELASKLLKWVKESTGKLDDRRGWPKMSIGELKKLRDETERFKCDEVPPKQHDKSRLASVAREIYRMAADVGVKIDPELHMDNIELAWERMLKALAARTGALDDELAKAERLRALLDKILADIKKTGARLDKVESDMNEEERRLSRLDNLRDAEAFSPQTLQRLSEELADCGIKIDSIKRLAEDFIQLAGRSHPDSVMVREKVAELDGRYKKLLAKLNNLHDQYERTIKRLRELDDERRRAQARKEAEAKLRLKLDAMKRELDELERRIDSMPPVARDLAALQRQLAELHDFDKDLSRARNNLNELIKLAEDMIRDDLIADPIALRADLQSLKDQLARIEDKAARRLRLFEEALKRAEAQKAAESEMALKLDAIKRQLDELERRLDSMAPVAREAGALQRQLEEMHEFERELDKAKRNLNDAARLADDLIRQDLISDPTGLRESVRALREQVARIEDKAAKRLRAIQEALKRSEAQKAAEAKYRYRLDDMKRKLDELERQLGAMAPVARDLATLQAQLAEIQDFLHKLGALKPTLGELLKLGDDLIRDDLIAEPAALKAEMAALGEQAKRLDGAANKRLRDIQNALGCVAASDAIQEVAQWLERARRVLVNEENVHGDLDTVNALIEQHKAFEGELAARQPAIAEVRRMEQELSAKDGGSGGGAGQVRDELVSLSEQWREMERLTRDKAAKLGEALRCAEQLHAQVHLLLEWLADAEMKLRFAGSLPDDELATKAELGEHEKLLRQLASRGQSMEQTLTLARDILAKCHPDAEPVIKHWINIVQSRWDEIDAWARQRGQRLADHLRQLVELLELVDELVNWLARHESRLLADEPEQLPEAAGQLDTMIEQHSAFMDELRKREPQVDRVVKVFAARAGQSTSKTILTTTTSTNSKQQSKARPATGARLGATSPARTTYASYRDEYPDVKQPRGKLMVDKWRSVWQLSLDRMQKLKDRSEHVKELERLESFDFDEWRRRFVAWLSAKKGRVTDFFRSIDDDNDGRIPNDAFVSAVLRAKFESSRLEMERVAETIDKNRDGTIDSKEFIDSLRPDKPVTDDELIQDEVQRQVSRCTCAQRFKVYHVGEGRYRFGESQKLRLVRILRSTVMVRVGGGWEPLISFLQKNDPCRAKGRTNVELREQFILPEGASQAMAAFRSKLTKDPGSLAPLGPITKIREKSDRSMPMSPTGSRLGSPAGSPTTPTPTPTPTGARPRSRIGRPPGGT